MVRLAASCLRPEGPRKRNFSSSGQLLIEKQANQRG
jgi:hypothetical protein